MSALRSGNFKCSVPFTQCPQIDSCPKQYLKVSWRSNKTREAVGYIRIRAPVLKGADITVGLDLPARSFQIEGVHYVSNNCNRLYHFQRNATSDRRRYLRLKYAFVLNENDTVPSITYISVGNNVCNSTCGGQVLCPTVPPNGTKTELPVIDATVLPNELTPFPSPTALPSLYKRVALPSGRHRWGMTFRRLRKVRNQLRSLLARLRKCRKEARNTRSNTTTSSTRMTNSSTLVPTRSSSKISFSSPIATSPRTTSKTPSSPGTFSGRIVSSPGPSETTSVSLGQDGNELEENGSAYWDDEMYDIGNSYKDEVHERDDDIW